MPPRGRITREMVVDAGFALARESGLEAVSVRAVARRLGCSTQPVMYHFKRVEALRRAVYERADQYHTAYLTEVSGPRPLLEIGLAYIRFAQTEKPLFHLLFQSNEFAGGSLAELTDAAAPVLSALGEAAGAGSAKGVFKYLFLSVHGYASMFANNALVYDEAVIAADLERIFTGAVRASGEEENR